MHPSTIGAHIGTFSLLASLHSHQVFAYEPNPQNLKLLKKNIVVQPLALYSQSRKHPIPKSPSFPNF